MYKTSTLTNELIGLFVPRGRIELPPVDDLFNGNDKVNFAISNGVNPTKDFYNVSCMTAPPPTLSAMMQYKNTVQWEANRGCYVTAAFHPESMTHYKSRLDRNHLFTTSDLPGSDPSQTNAMADIDANPVNFDPLTADRTGKAVTNAIIPCGAYFTSLHPQATFNLTVRFIFEKIPDYISPLRTLAQNLS